MADPKCSILPNSILPFFWETVPPPTSYSPAVVRQSHNPSLATEWGTCQNPSPRCLLSGAEGGVQWGVCNRDQDDDGTLSSLLGQNKQGYETRAPSGPAFHLVEMAEKTKPAQGEQQKREVHRDGGPDMLQGLGPHPSGPASYNTACESVNYIRIRKNK